MQKEAYHMDIKLYVGIAIIAVILIMRAVIRKISRRRYRGKWYYRLCEDIRYYIRDIIIRIQNIFNPRQPDPDFLNRFFEENASKGVNNKPWNNSKYFSVCKTKEELTKKYRELAKIYHPDNSKTGIIESFSELRAEYDKYNH